MLRRSVPLSRESYQQWIEEFDWSDARDRYDARRMIDSSSHWPVISVVMPVYDTERAFLVEAIESVRRQVYPHWELCIADDASPSPHIREVLQHYRQLDNRIKISLLPQNGNISRTSNHALNLATGRWVAMMDHDDVLAPHALLMVALETTHYADAELIYTDSDNLDVEGRRCSPYFKPDWNYDLLLAQNYLNHLTIFRRSRLVECGGFRPGFEGSQDYDMLLRYLENIHPATIRHIPHILYHWRIVPSSVSRANLDEANRRARAAIQEHLDRLEQAAQVDAAPGIKMFHCVCRSIPDPPPRVSVVALFREGDPPPSEWAKQVQSSTEYPNCEFVVGRFSAASNRLLATRAFGSQTTVEQLDPIAVGSWSDPFNLLAQVATGEILVLFDEPLMPLGKDWLRVLVGHAVRPELGFIGGRTLNESGDVDLSRTMLAYDSLIPAAMVDADAAGSTENKIGYFGRWLLDHRVPAVSEGCFAVRKKDFECVDGFDPRLRSPAIRAVDLSQRISQLGLGILWSARSQFVRRGRVGAEQNPTPSEIRHMTLKWRARLETRLRENPNFLSRGSGQHLLFPPHASFPWRGSAIRAAA
jgi:GT2 family glycosyltransferase